MIVDIVSDLHVDYWKDEYDWESNRTSDTVIIAGDVADTVTATVRELRRACDVYKTVLYVHGNHEATSFYANLRETNERIAFAMKECPNFVYLCNEDYVTDSIVFLGACGWWDSDTQGTESWTDVSPSTVTRNVIRSAHYDYERLKERVCRYPATRICIVTHTVPCLELVPAESTQLCNSMMQAFMDDPNVTHFVFGHSHRANALDTFVRGKRFYSNPRSRPDDFNRRVYVPLIADFGECQTTHVSDDRS